MKKGLDHTAGKLILLYILKQHQAVSTHFINRLCIRSLDKIIKYEYIQSRKQLQYTCINYSHNMLLYECQCF